MRVGQSRGSACAEKRLVIARRPHQGSQSATAIQDRYGRFNPPFQSLDARPWWAAFVIRVTLVDVTALGLRSRLPARLRADKPALRTVLIAFSTPPRHLHVSAPCVR